MVKKVVCHDENGKSYKIDSKKLAFRPSIYGVLIEKNKVLLSKWRDGYDFPGGGAEIYETIEDTLRREFWEETGFKVKPVKLVRAGSYFRYSLVRKRGYNIQYFYFLVKKISGRLTKANFDEHEKKLGDLAQWIDIKQIGKIKFYNDLYTKGSIKLIRDVYGKK